MASVAVTPRVRTIVICDDISGSLTEDVVFTLEGVRLQIRAWSFPIRVKLYVYLLVSCPRKGRYSGKVLFVNERSEKPVRYINFHATFDEENDLLPVFIDLGHCVFPEAGPYNLEVYFSTRDGEALNGEHPFTVLSDEE